MPATATKKANPLLATRVFGEERISKMELDEALEIHSLVVKAMGDLEGQPPAVVEALSKNHTLISNKINATIGVVAKIEEEAEETEEADESKVSKSLYCEFVQKDIELRLVTGILLIPEVVDLQGDIISEEDIRMIAHNFMADYRANSNDIGEQHLVKNEDIVLAESWLVPHDMTLEGREVIKGTWIATVKVIDDAVWKKVKEGEYTGFSIAGLLPVEDLEEAA